MDFKNFTIKAQEAVQKATEIAGGKFGFFLGFNHEQRIGGHLVDRAGRK